MGPLGIQDKDTTFEGPGKALNPKSHVRRKPEAKKQGTPNWGLGFRV